MTSPPSSSPSLSSPKNLTRTDCEERDRTAAAPASPSPRQDNHPPSPGDDDQPSPVDPMPFEPVDAQEIVDPLYEAAEKTREYIACVNSHFCSELERSKELRSELDSAEAIIKKREGQVINARQKNIRLNEVVETLRNETEEYKTRIEEFEQEINSLNAEIERLNAENREFKKVSRLVAIENENSKLVEENARLHRLLTKPKTPPPIGDRK